MEIPTILLIVVTFGFLIAERLWPGRQLPQSSGWYARALILNLIQLGIVLFMGRLWVSIFASSSLFSLRLLDWPLVEGFIAWFIGTFFFYWWHRLRHRGRWWEIFHQIHHSPKRIEILTSFYKHPFEIVVNSLLSLFILYPLLGVSISGAFWYNFFAATGEYFYHANLKSPGWLRYFIQTPQLHSIHHQRGVHRYNYGDIPLWDRLFGTYKDTVFFMKECGLEAEERLLAMLVFKEKKAQFKK